MNRRSFFATLGALPLLNKIPGKAFPVTTMETPWGKLSSIQDVSYIFGKRGIYQSVRGTPWVRISKDVIDCDAYGDYFNLGGKK